MTRESDAHQLISTHQVIGRIKRKPACAWQINLQPRVRGAAAKLARTRGERRVLLPGAANVGPAQVTIAPAPPFAVHRHDVGEASPVSGTWIGAPGDYLGMDVDVRVQRVN